MALKEYRVNLKKILLHRVAQPDLMLCIMKWRCEQLMETEVSQKRSAFKN